MRPITKPPFPNIELAYSDFAIALTNAVGGNCSFCEKALNFSTYLFHKITGNVPTNASLTANDWDELLLICGECGDSVVNFSPQSVLYIWPDSAIAKELPFRYVKRDNVSYKALDPAGNVLGEEQRSYVFVEPAPGLRDPVLTGVRNTIDLFKLNTKFYNNNPSQPEVTIPYGDFVEVTDVRLEQRMEAYKSSAEMTNNLIDAFPTLRVNRAFVDNIFVLANLIITRMGYISTWEAAVKDNMPADMVRQFVAPEVTRNLTPDEQYNEVVQELMMDEVDRPSKRPRMIKV